MNGPFQRKICFFEWMPSFLGEPAEMLGRILLKYGALELLHFACKVGIFTTPTQVHDMVFAPTYFLLRHDGLTQRMEITNASLVNLPYTAPMPL